jgi:uncharacterized protein (TIGR02246 family)
MKSMVGIFYFMLAFSVLVFQQSGEQGMVQAQNNTQETEAINALLQEYSTAWENGDGTAFAAIYTEDARHVTFGGERLQGREAIQQVHQELFNTFLKGSRLELKLEEVRLLNPAIAVIYVSGGILEPGQTELTPERNSVQSAVLVKENDAWRIASLQVTRVQVEGMPQ